MTRGRLGPAGLLLGLLAASPAAAGPRLERLKAKPAAQALRTAGRSTSGWKANLAAGIHGFVIQAPRSAYLAIKHHKVATAVMVGGLTALGVAGGALDVDLTVPMLAANLTALGIQSARLLPRIARTRGPERAELVGQLGFWTGLSLGTAQLGMGHDHGAAPAFRPEDYLCLHDGGSLHHADAAHILDHMHTPGSGNMSGATGLVFHAGHFAALFSQLAAAVGGGAEASR